MSPILIIVMTGYNKTRTHRILTDHTLYWKLQVKYTVQLMAVLELINDFLAIYTMACLHQTTKCFFIYAIRKVIVTTTATHVDKGIHVPVNKVGMSACFGY